MSDELFTNLFYIGNIIDLIKGKNEHKNNIIIIHIHVSFRL
jgi:hypothetical protein